jgi:hypothetical protein
MKTRAKTFDCVEMKRRGSLRIYEATKGMTIEQEVAYWREQDREFREKQARSSFERHSGKLDSGNPNSSDNERIDPVLGREFGTSGESG